MSLLYSNQAGKPFIFKCPCVYNNCRICKALNQFDNGSIIHYNNDCLYFIEEYDGTFNLEFIDHYGNEGVLIENISVDGLIDFEEIGISGTFLFKYEDKCIVYLDDKTSFEIMEPTSIHNNLNGITVIQHEQYLRVYSGSVRVKKWEIKELIRVFGFVSDTEVHCLIGNYFVNFDIINSSCVRQPTAHSNNWSTDGTMLYYLNGLIRIRITDKIDGSLSTTPVKVWKYKKSFYIEIFSSLYVLTDGNLIEVVPYLINYK